MMRKKDLSPDLTERHLSNLALGIQSWRTSDTPIYISVHFSLFSSTRVKIAELCWDAPTRSSSSLPLLADKAPFHPWAWLSRAAGQEQQGLFSCKALEGELGLPCSGKLKKTTHEGSANGELWAVFKATIPLQGKVTKQDHKSIFGFVLFTASTSILVLRCNT